jgi:fatty acid desaturase
VAEAELPNPEELHERREHHFSRRVALITAVYAVLLAIAALGGNHAMKEMILAQQQSSDQWAFYQAKVIREHQYRGQKLRLEVDVLERGDSIKPEAREKLDALIKRFAEEEKRYNEEKKDIEKEAKRLEHERDLWQAKDPFFLFAEALLQIAIVMASVSILARSGTIFTFSLVLAVAGALLTLNGYFLFFRLPLMPGGH